MDVYYDILGNWIAIILIIMVLSFALKDNRLFRFAAYTFAGIAAGHYAVMGINQLGQFARSFAYGNFLYAVPFIFGATMFFRFSSKFYWVTRFGFSLMLGIGLGISLRSTVTAQIVDQITDTILPLVVITNPLTTMNNILGVIGTITATAYFIFVVWPDKPRLTKTLDIVRKVGRLFIMAALGAGLGSSVLSRMVILIGVIGYLLFGGATPH